VLLLVACGGHALSGTLLLTPAIVSQDDLPAAVADRSATSPRAGAFMSNFR
jgi:hypothetical protein